MRHLLIVLLLALPLGAQTTATFFLTSQQNRGSGDFPFEGQNLDIEFDRGTGFGASISRGFGRYASKVDGELAVFRTSSSGSIRSSGTRVFDLGDLELTPVTAMLRAHFGHVYVGGGVAYVLTNDLDTEDGHVALDNEVAGVVGAGVTYDFSRRWGVALDVRYIPLSISGRPAPDDDRIDADVDPLLLSAGLRIRF
jgi:opacity protein-like surface antigen